MAQMPMSLLMFSIRLQTNNLSVFTFGLKGLINLQNKISLDQRLRMCADFVRQNARLADIGTDHAYLPLWLCLNGTCPSAIAADINPDPLSRGQAAIMNFNAEHLISTRLSNGLENIGENEADDFVIAGMGGELIAAILDSCTYTKNSEKHFILQPMTKSEVLIKYLLTTVLKF